MALKTLGHVKKIAEANLSASAIGGTNLAEARLVVERGAATDRAGRGVKRGGSAAGNCVKYT